MDGMTNLRAGVLDFVVEGAKFVKNLEKLLSSRIRYERLEASEVLRGV